MPTLPTLTVTDAQVERIKAVFGSVDGYKEWLQQALAEKVVLYEEIQKAAELVQQREAMMEDFQNEIT